MFFNVAKDLSPRFNFDEDEIFENPCPLYHTVIVVVLMAEK
jgi:hypothetical protein